MYSFSKRAPEVPVGPEQWLVEKILEHRVDDQGGSDFLVQWEGCEAKNSTWELLLNFLTSNETVMRYVELEGIPLEIVELWRTQGPKGS